MGLSIQVAKGIFKDRLAVCIEREGSLYAFLKRTGFAKGTIKAYLRGADPGLSKIEKLAEKLDVSAEWLAFGTGVSVKSDASGWTQIEALSVDEQGKLQVGPGPFRLHDDAIATIFPMNTVHRLATFMVPDSAISRCIGQNTWVFVDRGSTEPEIMGAYCILVNGVLKARYICTARLNIYSMSSDTEEPPIEFTREDVGPKLTIVGRIADALAAIKGTRSSRFPTLIA